MCVNRVFKNLTGLSLKLDYSKIKFKISLGLSGFNEYVDYLSQNFNTLYSNKTSGSICHTQMNLNCFI